MGMACLSALLCQEAGVPWWIATMAYKAKKVWAKCAAVQVKKS